MLDANGQEKLAPQKGVIFESLPQSCHLHQSPHRWTDQVKGGAHLSSGVVHYFLGGEVTLVSHQQLVDVFTGVAVDFLEPLLYVVVGFLKGGKLCEDAATPF